jgi:hypothetical protein
MYATAERLATELAATTGRMPMSTAWAQLIGLATQCGYVVRKLDAIVSTHVVAVSHVSAHGMGIISISESCCPVVVLAGCICHLLLAQQRSDVSPIWVCQSVASLGDSPLDCAIRRFTELLLSHA